tara:strand:- start:6810 stop:7109 length:300 start_codon:yes stop_codon:yes gene_type:complete
VSHRIENLLKLSTSYAFKQLGKPLEKSWLKSYTYKQDARASKCSLRIKNGQPHFVFSGTWLNVACVNEDGTFNGSEAIDFLVDLIIKHDAKKRRSRGSK